MKALHKAGIEVLLDLVYNHTVEGGRLQPWKWSGTAACMRGPYQHSWRSLIPQAHLAKPMDGWEAAVSRCRHVATAVLACRRLCMSICPAKALACLTAPLATQENEELSQLFRAPWLCSRTWCCNAPV